MIVLLFLQAGGLLFVYQMQQYVAREQMQQLLLNKNITKQKIILDHSAYAQCKVGNAEIFVNGKMYDVRSIKTIGENVELEVVNDTKEEGILSKISQLSNGLSKDNKLLEILVGLLTLDFVQPANVSEICSLSILITRDRTISIRNNNPLLSFFCDIKGPPPKIA